MSLPTEYTHRPGRRAAASLSAVAAAGAFLGLTDPASAQVFTSDVVIQGSLCVGIDCPSNPSFGFSTIILQENNLRIRFTDTSNTASFPTTDWEITANETTNGGQDMFAVTDITNGSIPFTIEGNAASNSLYVDSTSRIGLKTSTPAVELHLRDGDTPTVRLEQDSSSGFTPQTWDIAGNEANFFIRDVTNGSRLSFKIKPGAPTSSIFVQNTGNIGLLTEAPTASLHVRRSDGTAKILVQEVSTTGAGRELFRMENNGGSYFTLQNTATAKEWYFTHENNVGGRFIINSSITPNLGMFFSSNGNMTIGGTLTQNSDKNNKMAIEPVDTGEILQKVTALPVSAWTYKHDEEGARHIGPMAQDFHALFGLGASETGISTIDTSGVALAAIQALESHRQQADARLAEQAGLIFQQQEVIADLKARLEALLETAR